MPILLGGFRRHLDDRVFASRVHGFTQKVLNEESSRSGHLIQIRPDVVIDLEFDGGEAGGFFSGGVQYGRHEFDRGGFTFGAGDRDDEDVSRRMSINIGT